MKKKPDLFKRGNNFYVHWTSMASFQPKPCAIKRQPISTRREARRQRPIHGDFRRGRNEAVAWNPSPASWKAAKPNSHSWKMNKTRPCHRRHGGIPCRAESPGQWRIHPAAIRIPMAGLRRWMQEKHPTRHIARRDPGNRRRIRRQHEPRQIQPAPTTNI